MKRSQRNEANSLSNGKEVNSIKPLSVRLQLMLVVNLTLGVLLAVLLVWEYRREMSEAVVDKQAALQDEAIAVHQAVTHLLKGHGLEDVQQYVDTVCSAMRDSRSPGHHIVVEFDNRIVHAHRAESRELFGAIKSGIHFSKNDRVSFSESDRCVGALQAGMQSPDHQVTFHGKQLVVASQTNGGVTVYISEYLTNVRRAIRSEVLWQSAILAGLGLLATLIVNVTLIKLVTRPLQSLATVVTQIASGKFDVEVSSFGNSELDDLAQAVNSMSVSLAESEQHRQRQMKRAREIQEHLLPQQFQIPGMKAAALYCPAEDVAGDYYDVFPLPDGTWLICVADVVGHGVPAAMGAAMLKMLVANAVEHYADPADVLSFVNRRFVAASLPGYFASVFLARWHPAKLQMDFANAGHEPGLVFHDGAVTSLKATGMFVGVGEDLTWETQTLQLTAGQRLLIMTDGVVEAADSDHNLFGRQRTQQMFVESQDESLEKSLKEIKTALTAHQGNASALDDITLLMIEIALLTLPAATSACGMAVFTSSHSLRRIF